MKLKTFLEQIKGADEDAEVFVESRGYDPEDDATWMVDTQSDIHKVYVEEGEVHIIIDCDEFD